MSEEEIEDMLKINRSINDLEQNFISKIEQLQQENQQLKEELSEEREENFKLSSLWCKSQTNWNKLEDWLKEVIKLNSKHLATEPYLRGKYWAYKNGLSKMQEIGGSNE